MSCQNAAVQTYVAGAIVSEALIPSGINPLDITFLFRV